MSLFMINRQRPLYLSFHEKRAIYTQFEGYANVEYVGTIDSTCFAVGDGWKRTKVRYTTVLTCGTFRNKKYFRIREGTDIEEFIGRHSETNIFEIASEKNELYDAE